MLLFPVFSVSTAERIPEGNVGHQMLRRMGWEGTGLGSSHQGIQEPVHGGDVRDKGDKYKVGCHLPLVLACALYCMCGSDQTDTGGEDYGDCLPPSLPLPYSTFHFLSP